jgi:hypothetical protein
MFPKICKKKNCAFNTPDANGRCAASYSDFELAACPYTSKQQEIESLKEKNDNLRVVLESAQAALWDAFSGKCIAKEYMKSVDTEIRKALNDNTETRERRRKNGRATRKST